MRSIKIAVYLDQKLRAGGGYQQALNMILLFKSLSVDNCSIHYVTSHKNNVALLKSYGLEADYFPMPKWLEIVLRWRRSVTYPPFVKLIRRLAGRNTFEAYFVKNNVDLIYFLSPSEQALNLECLNYCFTVWDLCHRDDPEFPEVRNDRQFERREELYHQALPKATAVFADSEIGKSNIVKRYGIDDERVHILPFSPSVAVNSIVEDQDQHENMKHKYGLDCDYVFYPAQFWAHKNHVYILQAIAQLEREYDICLGAIFSGGGSTAQVNYVKGVAVELGLADRICFAGFVSNEEMPLLYLQSLALVMPTYFGPTNLPPLEAFRLGVPVCYPDKHGLREQVGDAALLMNLENPGCLATHLAELIQNDRLREDLISKGKIRFNQLDRFDRAAILENVFRSFYVRRQCWG